MADRYLLRVTAGPSYDESTHVVLPINTEKSTTISSDHCTASVIVRVQNFRGIPHDLPSTSPYFEHASHTYDQYSIGFSFVPHASISGGSLVFGNDFDRPIRDRLPPGFGTAFNIVKWVVDPGLEGDVYADKPYLYGPALSSLNLLRVGGHAERATGGQIWTPGDAPGADLAEGANNEDSQATRDACGCPHDSAARKKWALTAAHRDQWEWEAGRVYQADFFNPYLDFNSFSLKLPGFSLGVLPFLDGKDSLRYVLKDKETGNLFFTVIFTLVLKEDHEKEQNGKSEVADQPDIEFEPKDDDLD